MKDAKKILQDYMELGSDVASGKVAFRFTDGRWFEGYIWEIEGDEIVCTDSGPMADYDLEFRIPINTVDIGSFEYVHTKTQQWVKLCPDED